MKNKAKYFNSTSFLEFLQFVHFFFFFFFCYHRETYWGKKLENTNGARFVENKNTLFPAGARSSRPGEYYKQPADFPLISLTETRVAAYWYIELIGSLNSTRRNNAVGIRPCASYRLESTTDPSCSQPALFRALDLPP